MNLIKFFVILLIVIAVVFSVIENLFKQETKLPLSSVETHAHTILIIKRIVYIVYAVIVGLSLLAGSIFFTNEQQIGFTSLFGQVSLIDGPGMHFKVPFMSKRHIYDATTKGMPIGYEEESEKQKEEDSLMITSDFNFINIDFYIEYRITDPVQYCYGSNDPEGILKNIAQSAIRNTVGQYSVDSAMTTGKAEIEAKVFDDIAKELEEHAIGLTIVNATIQDSEPPTDEVAKAFKDVENAKQNAETAINEAHEYENQQIPAAEAKAEEVKQAATASKTERINKAKEEIAKFEALFAEYQNNPETVKNRLYFEALQEILPKMEIIIGKDSKVIYIKDNAAEESEDAKASSKKAEKE